MKANEKSEATFHIDPRNDLRIVKSIKEWELNDDDRERKSRLSFISSKNSQYQKKDVILDPKIIGSKGDMMVCRL